MNDYISFNELSQVSGRVLGYIYLPSDQSITMVVVFNWHLEQPFYMRAEGDAERFHRRAAELGITLPELVEQINAEIPREDLHFDFDVLDAAQLERSWDLAKWKLA